ncbi:MAG: TolC family protein [Candidatus Eisenbacteria bacterium]|nr:TolC family protein [Candidatus Eisenbacteria bacterium]
MPFRSPRARRLASARLAVLTGIFLLFTGPAYRLRASETTGSLNTDDRPELRLSLDDALGRARRQNPGVRASREAEAAALGLFRQAGAWPNPEFQYEREQLKESGVATTEQRVQIVQELDWSGARGARRTAARHRREASSARVSIAELDLDLEVRRQYAARAVAERHVTIADSLVSQFERAVASSEERRLAGEASDYEVRRLRIEAARLRSESMARRTELDASRIGLPLMLGLPIDSVRVITDWNELVRLSPLGAWPDSELPDVVANHPERLEIDRERQAAAAERHSVRASRWAGPSLGLGWKWSRLEPTGQADGPIVSIAIPLPLWNRSAGQVDAAEAEIRRLTIEMDGIERRLSADLRRMWEAARSADARLAELDELMDTEMPLLLTTAETAWREGEFTLLEWLDAVRAAADLESEHLALLLQRFVRRAELTRALARLTMEAS